MKKKILRMLGKDVKMIGGTWEVNCPPFKATITQVKDDRSGDGLVGSLFFLSCELYKLGVPLESADPEAMAKKIDFAARDFLRNLQTWILRAGDDYFWRSYNFAINITYTKAEKKE